MKEFKLSEDSCGNLKYNLRHLCKAKANLGNHSFFFAASENAYSTVARLVDGDPHLSGYISDRNRERLPGSPSVMADRLGRGIVVLLVDNTNFRGYWRGTNRLFLNALFFGNHIQVP